MHVVPGAQVITLHSEIELGRHTGVNGGVVIERKSTHLSFIGH